MFFTALSNVPVTVFDYAVSAYQMGYLREDREQLITTLYTELDRILSEIVAAEQLRDLTRYRDQLIYALETVDYVRLPELERLVEQGLLALGQSFDIAYIWDACIEIQKALQRILNQLIEMKSKLILYFFLPFSYDSLFKK